MAPSLDNIEPYTERYVVSPTGSAGHESNRESSNRRSRVKFSHIVEYRPIEAVGNGKPVGDWKNVMEKLKKEARVRRQREDAGGDASDGSDKR